MFVGLEVHSNKDLTYASASGGTLLQWNYTVYTRFSAMLGFLHWIRLNRNSIHSCSQLSSGCAINNWLDNSFSVPILFSHTIHYCNSFDHILPYYVNWIVELFWLRKSILYLKHISYLSQHIAAMSYYHFNGERSQNVLSYEGYLCYLQILKHLGKKIEWNWEHFHGTIFYEFRRGLNQQQCTDQLTKFVKLV